MTDPLIIDVSSHSRDTLSPSSWTELDLIGAPWHGVIVKATEGIGASGKSWERTLAAWFSDHWPAIRTRGGDRYGVDWLRGAYHFLRADGRGRAQAHHYLATIDRAGGWGVGDLWPVVDVEEGSGNGAVVAQHGRAIVEDTARAFVETVNEELGRDVVLYAGWWLASIGIADRLGCEWLWYASYTRTLPAAVYRRIGWSTDRLLLWQYDGSGTSDGSLTGYPTRAPIAHGKDVDINVLTLPGGLTRLRSLLWAERPDGMI